MAPVVLVNSSGRRLDIQEDYRRRRSIVLDTPPLEAHVLLDRATLAQHFREALPRGDVDAVSLPHRPLTQIVEVVILAILPGLNDDGRQLYDERGLALLVLGRAGWARLGLEETAQAVVGLDTHQDGDAPQRTSAG